MTASTQTFAVAPARGSLMQNTIALYALQIANYIIPFLTLPYLIRVLGAQSYGAMAIANAVVFYMVLLVDAGINTRAVRELSSPGISHERINQIFAATQWIRALVATSCLLLLLVLMQVVPSMQQRPALYLASFMMVIGTWSFPTWLFQGLEVMHITTCCSVFGRLLITALIFAFVKGPDDLVLGSFLQCSGTAVSGMIASYFMFKKLGLRLFMPWQSLKQTCAETARASAGLWLSEFKTNAVSNSGVFILSAFAGEATVGIYAALEKISLASLSMFQPLQKALFPRVASHWRGGDGSDIALLWSRRLIMIGLLAAAGMYVVAPWGVQLLFGPTWASQSGLLRIISLWLFIAVSSSSINQLWLLARGRNAQYSRILLSGAVVQLLMSIAGAAFYGATGIIFALLAAECVRLVYTLLSVGHSIQRTSK